MIVQVRRFELYIRYENETGVVQVISSDEQGRSVDPISLQVDSEFVMSFSELFSASQQQQIATLATEKENLIAAKTSLESQVNTLTATVESLTSEVASLQPWNKRWIDPKKFVARFTGTQAQAVYESIDPLLVAGRALLKSYIVDNYHVDLDDEKVTGLTAHMLTIVPPILTPQEREEILRDSSSFERYVPTA